MSQSSPQIAVTPPPLCNSKKIRDEITKAFPQAVFNDRGRYLKEEELIEFAREADGLLVGRDLISEKVLSDLPRLKIISKYGVGRDNLDQEALNHHQVTLGWSGGVNRRSVAELTLCFMLSLCHNVHSGGESLKQGRWVKDGGRLLEGKTVGIIGCGNIGKEVIDLLQPFGCSILVRDILDMAEFCREKLTRQVGFEEVMSRSDVVSLHVPLTEDTRHLVGREALAKMKPEAFLINTSRGEVVDEKALKDALLSEKLAGAALDVFATEPPEDLELLQCSRLTVTPHIGGNTVEAVEAMGRSALGHLVNFFKG